MGPYFMTPASKWVLRNHAVRQTKSLATRCLKTPYNSEIYGATILRYARGEDKVCCPCIHCGKCIERQGRCIVCHAKLPNLFSPVCVECGASQPPAPGVSAKSLTEKRSRGKWGCV